MAGDYGKAGPALVVQDDLSDGLLSVVVCPLTTTIRDDLGYYRVTIEPTPRNGLQARSQIAVDKPNLAWRAKLREPVGHADADTMAKVDRALVLLLGLA